MLSRVDPPQAVHDLVYGVVIVLMQVFEDMGADHHLGLYPQYLPDGWREVFPDPMTVEALDQIAGAFRKQPEFGFAGHQQCVARPPQPDLAPPAPDQETGDRHQDEAGHPADPRALIQVASVSDWDAAASPTRPLCLLR